MGRKNWGLVRQACELIEKARARDLEITADQYPFRFSSGYPYRSLIPISTWRGEGQERLTNRDIDNIFGHLSDKELIDRSRIRFPAEVMFFLIRLILNPENKGLVMILLNILKVSSK